MINNTHILMNTSDALWLCLNFPLLPVEVFCRQESSPVVVMTRQRVSFMNQPARSIGIMPGSSMSTAYTISDHVVSFERDEDKELRRLEHLAQWAYQFTPCVSLAPAQNLLLEISGCLKLFRGLANLKKSIHDRLSAQGYTVKMGVNGTPQAALCSATAMQGLTRASTCRRRTRAGRRGAGWPGVPPSADGACRAATPAAPRRCGRAPGRDESDGSPERFSCPHKVLRGQ